MNEATRTLPRSIPGNSAVRAHKPGLRSLVRWHDRCANALIRIHPGLALLYGATLGRVASRLQLYGATPGQIGELLPALPKHRRREIAQAVSATAWLNRVPSPLIQRIGYDQFDQLVDSHCDAQLRQLHDARRPAILGFVHAGPHLALSSTLHRLGIPALAITRARHHRGNTSLDVCHVRDTAASHRATLRRAIDRLRDGGVVLWALDYPGLNKIPVQLFAREFGFARGPFAALRLSGAQLIPLTARWTRCRRIEVWSGESLSQRAHGGGSLNNSRQEALAADQAVANAAAAWFERYFQEYPEQISMGLVRKLLPH